MTETLKPCPFCGHAVYLEKKPLWWNNGSATHGYFNCYEYVVRCNNLNCGCSVNLTGNDTIYRDDKEALQNAIKAWNRRAE